MNAIGLAPVAVAFAVAAVAFLAPYSRRVDATLSRVARRYFGRYVPDDAPERRRRLRAAYVDETYRAYAAKTYLLTAFAAMSSVILGVYLVGGGLLALPTIEAFVERLPDAMSETLGRIEFTPDLTERQVFGVLTAGGSVVGLLVAGGTYWYRWEKPRSDAELRRRGINEGLPRTVAFVYALSRGGMAVPDVMRTLADNRAVYGHGADEVAVAVREMDLFGRDMVTAVHSVSARTPSEQFKTFSENLASVLQSGRNLSAFLREQYERYREEAEDRQEEILELLATIAEAYVTTLVAGTLFLMTILLVFGLTTANTLTFLQLLAYVLIPLANLLFVVYLAGKLEVLGVARGGLTGGLAAAVRDRQIRPDPQRREATPSGPGGTEFGSDGRPGSDTANASGDAARASADGGYPAAVDERSAGGREAGGPATDRSHGAGAAVGRQLAAYDSIGRVKRVTDRPLAALLRKPTRILYLTVPVAILSVLLRAPEAYNNGTWQLRVLDDVVVQALIFVIGTFAVVWELYSRRIARMEAALPELLERLASLNEAGMSMIESIERVRESDLGPLSLEVDRVSRDLQYGSNVDDALRRFGLRVRTTATTRVVTLVTNALRASGNLAPVLRIAAEQANAELKLRRKRRQDMLTYLVVIYVSFFVFLVIIAAVNEVLVPSLPNEVPTPETGGQLAVEVDQFARFGNVNKAAYTLVFFHTAMIQAVLSGFIGGQIGEGSLKDGAKHAAVLLAIAYLVFLVLSSPVAQVTFADQQTNGESVVVESVSTSKGGFVAIRVGSADGEVIGHSEYLGPGEHENVRVAITESPDSERTLYAVPHLDANGNERFDFAGAGGTDAAYPSKRTRIFDSATVTPPDANEDVRAAAELERGPSSASDGAS